MWRRIIDVYKSNNVKWGEYIEIDGVDYLFREIDQEDDELDR